MINPGIVPRSRGDLCDFCETADKNLYIDMLSVHMGVMLMREYKSPRKGQISILHPWLCTCQNRFWKSKNPDKIGVCSDNIFFVALIWWTRRDSNPRSLRCERSAFPAKLRAHITLITTIILLQFDPAVNIIFAAGDMPGVGWRHAIYLVR